MLLRALISDGGEQRHMFSAIETMPSVRAKAEWCLRWIESPSAGFATRLVAFAIVEGIFFSSSFAAIFWLRSRGLMPALCQSNELIARDEGMHTVFACMLFRHLAERPEEGLIREMVIEAVGLEQRFFACKSLLSPVSAS